MGRAIVRTAMAAGWVVCSACTASIGVQNDGDGSSSNPKVKLSNDGRKATFLVNGTRKDSGRITKGPLLGLGFQSPKGAFNGKSVKLHVSYAKDDSQTSLDIHAEKTFQKRIKIAFPNASLKGLPKKERKRAGVRYVSHQGDKSLLKEALLFREESSLVMAIAKFGTYEIHVHWSLVRKLTGQGPNGRNKSDSFGTSVAKKVLLTIIVPLLFAPTVMAAECVEQRSDYYNEDGVWTYDILSVICIEGTEKNLRELTVGDQLDIVVWEPEMNDVLLSSPALVTRAVDDLDDVIESCFSARRGESRWIRELTTTEGKLVEFNHETKAFGFPGSCSTRNKLSVDGLEGNFSFAL